MRLVESQKLREGHDLLDSDNAFGNWNKNMEKAAREEVPLGRKNTNHLLASDILALTACLEYLSISFHYSCLHFPMFLISLVDLCVVFFSVSSFKY